MERVPDLRRHIREGRIVVHLRRRSAVAAVGLRTLPRRPLLLQELLELLGIAEQLVGELGVQAERLGQVLSRGREHAQASCQHVIAAVGVIELVERNRIWSPPLPGPVKQPGVVRRGPANGRDVLGAPGGRVILAGAALDDAPERPSQVGE
jgi:hypothetical protein